MPATSNANSLPTNHRVEPWKYGLTRVLDTRGKCTHYLVPVTRGDRYWRDPKIGKLCMHVWVPSVYLPECPDEGFICQVPGCGMQIEKDEVVPCEDFCREFLKNRPKEIAEQDAKFGLPALAEYQQMAIPADKFETISDAFENTVRTGIRVIKYTDDLHLTNSIHWYKLSDAADRQRYMEISIKMTDPKELYVLNNDERAFMQHLANSFSGEIGPDETSEDIDHGTRENKRQKSAEEKSTVKMIRGHVKLWFNEVKRRLPKEGLTWDQFPEHPLVEDKPLVDREDKIANVNWLTMHDAFQHAVDAGFVKDIEAAKHEGLLALADEHAKYLKQIENLKKSSGTKRKASAVDE